MDTQYLTEEKFEELKVELKDLQENKTRELAVKIDDARQNGDLSENAEYHQAREELAWAQGRILEIQSILDSAEIIQKSNSSSIQLGSTIEIEMSGKKMIYTIVGAQEANPGEGKISNESPIGKAFIGKKKGDTVSITVPAGEITYNILNVS